MKKKTFRDNESYFEFYNKMRDLIDIISIRVLRNCIKIEYVMRVGVDND